MPTSRLAALAGVLALAACDPALTGASRTSVFVAGRSVSFAAPPGYCIDAGDVSVSEAGAFALMGGCADGDARPALTASVSAEVFGEGDAAQDLTDLAAFVATDRGRALMGRSGHADRTQVLSTVERAGVLYVLVEDRGPQPIAGVDDRFWRAFLLIDDHIAVLSVVGFAGGGVDAQQGLDLLVALADAMQRANRA